MLCRTLRGAAVRSLLAAFAALAMLCALTATASASSHLAVVSHLGTIPSPEAQAAQKATFRGSRLKLQVPTAGDGTYGILQVRLGRSSNGDVTRGLGAKVFAGKVGGLTLSANSRAWGALKRSTKVYVVTSRVVGQPASVRNIAFFVLRRKGGSPAPSSGTITLTIANAKPVTRSFWIKSVKSGGYADAFQVRNFVQTAISNWTRYLAVLRAANAIKAAVNPKDVTGVFTNDPVASKSGARAAQSTGAKLITGGHRMSARVNAMFKLIFGAMRDRMAYQAVKRNPLVPQFIATELNNPALALQWQQLVARVPLKVPDRYASAAQAEAKFANHPVPRISRNEVRIADHINSAQEAHRTVPKGSFGQIEIALTKSGTGSGRVVSEDGGIDCGGDCKQSYGPQQRVVLTATPDRGSKFVRWEGGGRDSACDEQQANVCVVNIRDVLRFASHPVEAVFEKLPPPTPPPAPADPTTGPLFGITEQWEQFSTQTMIGRSRDMGASANTFNITQQLVPDYGSNAGVAANWTHYEDVVAEMNRQGIVPVLILLGTPCGSSWCPGDATAWQTFLEGVIHHLGPINADAADPRPRIRALQIWNEPNLAKWWSGGANPPAYADLFNRSRAYIKQQDSRYLVLAGGMASKGATDAEGMADNAFLREAINSNMHGFDGVAYHPYPTGKNVANLPADRTLGEGSPVVTQMETAISRVRAAASIVAGGVKFWFTEWGLSTKGDDRSHPHMTTGQQAHGLAAMWCSMRRMPDVAQASVFRLEDPDPTKVTDPWEQGLGLWERGASGIGTGQEKPAVAALGGVVKRPDQCPKVDTIQMTMSPNPVGVNEKVTFTASGYTGPGPVTYWWDTDGNGEVNVNTGSSPTLTTTYQKATANRTEGPYKPAVVVVDPYRLYRAAGGNLTVNASTTPPPDPGVNAPAPTIGTLFTATPCNPCYLGNELPRISIRTGTFIKFQIKGPLGLPSYRVLFTFEQKKGGRFVKISPKMLLKAHFGINVLRFQGRINRRTKLKPGTYRMSMQGVNGRGRALGPKRRVVLKFAARR